MIQRGSGQAIGVKPQIKHASAVSSQLGSPANNRHQASKTPPQPQFSGLGARIANGSQDKLISIFGKISGVFLVAFLAQDVVAMWLPRIGVSLKRQREIYDPNQDPASKNMPMKDQVKNWVWKNFKGLNWANFAEVAGRELATGPGVLALPTLLYIFARRAYGKSAIELGHKPLKEMAEGFIEHLNTNASTVNKSILNAPITGHNKLSYINAFKSELASYIDHSIGDDAFRQWNLKRATSAAELTGKEFEKLVASHNTGADWLRNWSDRYSQLVVESAQDTSGQSKQQVKAARKLIEQKFEVLQQEMKTVVGDVYNKDILLGEELKKVRSGVLNAEGNPVKTSLTKVDEVAGKGISELMEEFHRGKDYFGQIFKEKMTEQGAKAKISDIAKGVFEKIVARKGIFAGGITILSGLYLIELTKYILRREHYPGERNSQAGGGH